MKVLDTARLISQAVYSAVIRYINIDQSTEHFHQLGFFSKAPANSRVLKVLPDGNPDNVITFHAHRPDYQLPFTLAENEAAMYNAQSGKWFIMRNNGDIETNSVIRCVNVITDKGVDLNEHTHLQNSGNHFGGGAETNPPTV